MTTSEAPSDRDQLDELGPIDYIVLEWPGREPSGEALPLVLDLVDRGVIRVIDVAFLTKDADGTHGALDVGSLPEGHEFFGFAGASTGLLGAEDLDEAAQALQPGSSAAVLIWENRWAAPVAAAMRRSGGQLVASGRIPAEAIIAALDATEAG